MTGIEIKEKKEELERQLNQASQVTNTLNTIEEKSRYFQLGVNSPQRFHSSPSQCRQSMTENNFDKMNQGGVRSDKPGYNRDKYQPSAVTHQYSLIGNPLKFGMEFDETDRLCAGQSGLQYKRHRAPDWLPKEAFMHRTKTELDPNPLPIDLPPNIQHQFGTKICQDVLKDKYKVDETISSQAQIRASFNKTRKSEKAKDVEIVVGDPDYEALSQVVRQNIFPGYSQNHKKSLMKSAYTLDVFQKRVPDPDQWRCQRDELSKYCS